MPLVPVAHVGVTVTHDTGLLAVQCRSQAVLRVTAMPPVAPLAGADTALVDTMRTHCVGDGDTACWSVTARPAMESVAMRDMLPVFGVAEYATLPFPEPDAGLIVSHELVVAADHAHPDWPVTPIVPEPPVAGTVTLVVESAGVQLGTPACVSATEELPTARVVVRAVVDVWASTV